MDLESWTNTTWSLQTSEYGRVEIEIYTDADYANDPVDRRSISGYASFVNGSLISYGSRKQGINALSTMDAEYIAMNEGARDVMWLRNLCKELLWNFHLPLLRCDNQAAICLTDRPGKHSKSKHIENKYHYVRRIKELKLVDTKYCSTEDMVADAMTKGLARVKFEKFRTMMGVVPKDTGARGSQ